MYFVDTIQLRKCLEEHIRLEIRKELEYISQLVFHKSHQIELNQISIHISLLKFGENK